MKEQPNGKVIIPPEEPETPEHLLNRIFGKTSDELVEELVQRFSRPQEADISKKADTDNEIE